MVERSERTVKNEAQVAARLKSCDYFSLNSTATAIQKHLVLLKRERIYTTAEAQHRVLIVVSSIPRDFLTQPLEVGFCRLRPFHLPSLRN